MDVEGIAAKLRRTRRKRPTTSSGGCPPESCERIRSIVASKWIDSVEVSRTRHPQSAPTHRRRPQSSPTGAALRGADRTRSGERLASATSDSARAPSWKHGNPYEKPFPRARIWTPKDLAGLSGEHPPPGWMTRVEREQEEAMLLAKEKENDISAKDLYAQLVLAAACARKERLLDLAATGAHQAGSDKHIVQSTQNGGRLEEMAPGNEPRRQSRDQESDLLEAPLDLCDGALLTASARELDDVAPQTDASPFEEHSPSVGEENKTIRIEVVGTDRSTRGVETSAKGRANEHDGDRCMQPISPSAGISFAPRAPSKPPPSSTCPRQSAASARHIPGAVGGKGGMADAHSTSSEDSSESSVSSEGSCDSDDFDGVLEDFTSGVDSWLEDVHGAGREAFFRLFKQDVTPQFSRPALGLLGRNGIGSSFVDGEPNIKYMPQRPIRLRESPLLRPPAPAPWTPMDTPAKAPKGPPPSRPGRTPNATSDVVEGTATQGLAQLVLQQDVVKPRQVQLATRKTPAGAAPDRPPNSTAMPATSSRHRPHSSPSMGGRVALGKGDGGASLPATTAMVGISAARSVDTRETDMVEGERTVETPKRRPRTADGREIEVSKLNAPTLDDFWDPAMVAHRMTKRPSSPRRDYLMRCAERQLLPVPVINTALRIDPSTAEPSTLVAKDQAEDFDVAGDAEGADGFASVRILGCDDAVRRKGCLVLRHYYLGAARAKCFESAITSVPVALREVELIDVGLDEVASETLLHVLAGKATGLSKLDLSRNSIGVRGATAVACLIASKGCALRSLKLDGNKCGDQAMIVVLKALQRHQPPVAHLGISDNRLTVKTMQECAGPLLSGGSSLHSLHLGWNHLNQQAVEELSDALTWNKSVTQVNLEFNNTGEGAHAIAEALQNNKTLTSLDLTANQVRWRGAIALAEAVAASPVIRRLILRDNPIGTAAGLQVGITLARRPGPPCLVDIKGCVCFSDKTDFWSGMIARTRAARLARITAIRKRNEAIRRAKKERRGGRGAKPPGTPTASTNVAKETKGSGGQKGPPTNAPSTPPSPTKSDEQLYWLDLSIARTWDLRLDRPFDRAIGFEVLRTFYFSTGGSLTGLLRTSGEAPRQLIFQQRHTLHKSLKGGSASLKTTTKAPPGRGIQTAGRQGRGGKRLATRGQDHPLASWLSEWTESKEIGWEGDAPPVAGLSLGEEITGLLEQLPVRGMLKLGYKPGTPLSSRLSLLHGTVLSGSNNTLGQRSTQQLIGNDVSSGRLGSENQTESTEGRHFDLSARPGDRSPDARVNDLLAAAECDGACEGGFEALIYLLRSLASPIQMCEMVECLLRRTWLNDTQLCAILKAFAEEPRMSEARCRAFLALVPNIRHNSLKALAKGLAPRVKRLQGVPPPDPAKEAKKEAAREKARLGPAGYAAAAAARARRDAREREAAKQGGRGQAQGGTDSKTREEKKEKDMERQRREILDAGWREGNFFDGLDVEILAGCSIATFRRFGLDGHLTRLEATTLGLVVENSATFNPFAPTGHYDLNMSIAGDRDVFRAILRLDKVNRAHVEMKEMVDPSQHGNGHFLRNFRLGGGRPVKFGLLSRRARTKLKKKAKKTAKKNKASAKAKPKPTSATGTQPTESTKSPKGRPKPRKPNETDAKSTRGKKRVGAVTTGSKQTKQSPGNAKTTPVVTAGAKTGTGKRFPTIPTVSRVSFDFLHYIRPPQEAVPVSREAFDQLLGALTAFDRGADVLPKTRERLRVNLLRNVCHVLYFECEQVVELMQHFPGESEALPPEAGEGSGGLEGERSYREEAFIAVFSNITDESNLDLCMGMLTDSELSRCEARLGLVSLFMPTQPDGDYKLDLRDFEERQIVTLLLGLKRDDPNLQLLGMRHDGKFLEEGSDSWKAGIPKRGRFRARVVSRQAFKTADQRAASEAARWTLARESLGWHETQPLPDTGIRLATAKKSSRGHRSVLARVGMEGIAPGETMENTRPRKRAVVRKSRKQKVMAKEAGRKAAETRARRQTFAHLPRPRLNRADILKYLGEAAKSPISGEAEVQETIPPDSSANGAPSVRDSAAEEPRAAAAGPDEAKQIDLVRDGGVSDAWEAIEVGGEKGVPPGRLLRRWPSSADIGMITDGV